MIRILIVDDDKLVRKGLTSSMPWQAYGMEVVGEANNGENALKFMEVNRIDLLMTDLSMPVMSGIELMRIVREKYPYVQIVVLSLHQDFEYVQEALRLGALDYIAKTQLEQEQFEEVLSRIVRLIERKGEVRAVADQQKNEAIVGGMLCVYYTLNPNLEESVTEHSVPSNATELESGIWYASEPPTVSFEPNLNIAVIQFLGLDGMDTKSVMQMIRTFSKNDLFYAYHPNEAILQMDAEIYLQLDKTASVIPIDQIKEQWGATDWIYEEAVFYKQLSELKALSMPPVRLTRIFYSLTDEWNRLYLPIMTEPISIADFFPNWFLFESWLKEVRERIGRAGAKPLFSQEIQKSIVKAMNLVQQNISKPISSSEIAQLVNMSGSYFSQCFKQYVGLTYTDYVRDIRLERAKEYLRGTTKTIQWIAEQIGYSDEKYFSRLFREHTGALPSEFRQISDSGRSK
ncbi:MAG: response regulator [Candidatus Cohnella colombiensis]|uniref:Response regulator n=1 Tax=Candidatus Cohnella colombiensis TaxID=3121368 RepID=A0AA95EXE5_9BACL|nr:MAG: response regulator [Cohnella sp.]